jgi:dienelactone hydrolase
MMARQQATGISPMMIRFGKGVGAVRALPKAKGKRPGVIILHERYGIDQHTKDLTVKLAHAGFVGLAPDLFHRFDGDRKAVLRGEQRVDVTDDGALEDLNGAVANLSSARPMSMQRASASSAYARPAASRSLLRQSAVTSPLRWFFMARSAVRNGSTMN